MKVAVESVVPVKSMASVGTAAAIAPTATATPSVARRRGNDQECKGEEGRCNCPAHTAYLADR